MKEIKRLIVVLTIAVFFIVFYFACDHYAKKAREYYNGNTSAQASEIDFINISVIDAVQNFARENMDTDNNDNTVGNQVKVSGIGDLMFYEYQLTRAHNEETDTFDFSSSFEYITDYLKSSDFVIGNLRTTLAGKDNGKTNDFFGYAADRESLNFNSPESVATALKDAGVTTVSTANANAMDSGREGLFETIDSLDRQGLWHTGTFKSSDEQKYLIKDINGINIGILAYANQVNEAVDTAQYGFTVNAMYNYAEENIALMCQTVKEMKQNGAEAAVIYLNAGDKYSSEPNDDQKKVVDRLFEAGADIIFGSQSHVLQPMEIRTITDSDGTTRTGVVFYSLGNFLSSQQYQEDNGFDRDIGLLADVTIVKSGEKIKLTQIDLTPTYTNWTDEAIAVLPVCEIHDNIDSHASLLEEDGTKRINHAFEEAIKTIIGDNGPSYTYSEYKYKIILENQLTN